MKKIRKRYAVTEYFLEQAVDVATGNADDYTMKQFKVNAERYLRKLHLIKQWEQDEHDKKMLALNKINRGN